MRWLKLTETAVAASLVMLHGTGMLILAVWLTGAGYTLWTGTGSADWLSVDGMLLFMQLGIPLFLVLMWGYLRILRRRLTILDVAFNAASLFAWGTFALMLIAHMTKPAVQMSLLGIHMLALGLLGWRIGSDEQNLEE